MISSARLFILSSLVLAGCHTAGKVAVSTFRVVDAPARFIRDRIDPPPATAKSQVSDVATPGRPVTAPPATPAPRHVTQTRTTSAAETTTPRPRPDSVAAAPRKPTPSATPRSSAAQTAQFPTAKPVPGKPGYVYSVDPKGGIVDVTGYKAGDKAKDPYTQQIFIVP